LEDSIISFSIRKIYALLVFCTSCFGKAMQGFWVKYNEGNILPKIHNLLKILSQSNTNLSQDQLEYLLEVNKFQLEGRYPDYMDNFQKICDLQYTDKSLRKIMELRKCLIENLQ
jgi:HEPN domain-containing protein